MSRIIALTLFTCAALITACSPADPAPTESPAAAVATASATFDGWPHYGGNAWNERHAQLNQITRDNVAQLTPRHVLQIPTPMNGLVGSPVVVDGMLYMALSSALPSSAVPTRSTAGSRIWRRPSSRIEWSSASTTRGWFIGSPR